MFPATVTLFWRDKTTKEVLTNDAGEPILNEDGSVQEIEVPYPPVTQEVEFWTVAGPALLLQSDDRSSYLVPFDILDAVSIFAKEVTSEADPGDSDGGETPIFTPDFGGGNETSETS